MQTPSSSQIPLFAPADLRKAYDRAKVTAGAIVRHERDARTADHWAERFRSTPGKEHLAQLEEQDAAQHRAAAERLRTDLTSLSVYDEPDNDGDDPMNPADAILDRVDTASTKLRHFDGRCIDGNGFLVDAALAEAAVREARDALNQALALFPDHDRAKAQAPNDD